MQQERQKINLQISYPQSLDYRYETYLEKIDLDKECENDIKNNRGFIIADRITTFEKSLKDEEGIFSTKFGQTLSDTNPYIDRYKCECGATKQMINFNTICPKCKTLVKFIDDDYEYFGWCKLKKYHVIHPNMYEHLVSLIGADRLDKIISFEDQKDENGHSKKKKKKIRTKSAREDHPYDGIGMHEFYNNFDEIIEYYYKKNSKKTEIYETIIKYRDIVFTQSIPVFTTYLRPFDVNGKNFSYESTNNIYKLIATHTYYVNNETLKSDKEMKPKEVSLYKLQEQFNELYNEILNIISGKKGNIRQLFGGRFSNSGRLVIVQDVNLEIDQITLSYYSLVELLQHQIINILKKSYNITYYEAWDILYRASINPDNTVIQIINSIIKSNPQGLPIIINRNPTIARGGVLQMYCVGMTMTYTMGVPLQILDLLAADFDGDVLNIFMIINKSFYQRASQLLNPKYMYISNNDGRTNISVIPDRDTLIISNGLIRLCRDNYNEDQWNKIQNIKEKAKHVYR